MSTLAFDDLCWVPALAAWGGSVLSPLMRFFTDQLAAGCPLSRPPSPGPASPRARQGRRGAQLL